MVDSTQKSQAITELRKRLYSIICGLLSGGIDAFLIESIYDFMNLKITLETILQIQNEKNLNIPIYFSSTIDEEGNILSGETLNQLYDKIIAHYPNPSGFGINCCSGIKMLEKKCAEVFENLAKIIKCPLIIYPSAGLPDNLGNYSEDPQLFSNSMKNIVEKLLKFNPKLTFIIGGCCGTTPDHIKALKDVFFLKSE